MAGLLSGLFGQRPQGGGFGGSILSDPETRLMMGAQMMMGKDIGQSLGGAFGVAGQMKATKREKMEAFEKQNRTLEFLRQANPELAAAVEAGALEPSKAYQMHLESQKPKEPDWMEVGGQLYSPGNDKWIQPPVNPNDPMKPPTVDTFYDEKTGQPYKGQWNPQGGTWDRVGGQKAGENGITITSNADGTTTTIGGSGTKSTEADRRALLLTQQIVSQEPQVMAGFDSLAEAQNAAGGAFPGGRAIQSPAAQIALDSLKNIVQNWMYLTSGATAPETEVLRNLEMVKPSFLDTPEALAAKKSRLKGLIFSMKQRVGMPDNSPPPPSGDGMNTTTTGNIPFRILD